MLNKLLKSVLDQDTAPVVICDMDDIIMRGAALNSLPLLSKIWVEPSRAHGYLAKVT